MKTMYKASQEFRIAMERLIKEICKELKIPQVVNWLSKLLNKSKI